jgi:hypothetical protein
VSTSLERSIENESTQITACEEAEDEGVVAVETGLFITRVLTIFQQIMHLAQISKDQKKLLLL